jgi:23S rRNA (cytosine1962-C5)-methyltransferase
MFSPEMYQLLDFGDGRRLERFGPWVLDRPCPAAEGVARADPAAWAAADARFERTGATEGRWSLAREMPERWTIAHGPIQLELKRTEFGHLGVFPEHAATWDWIAARLQPVGWGGSPSTPRDHEEAGAAPQPTKQPPVVLNLFAYTGGSTLAAAAAGAEVVHVDAAKNVVAWARRNAELSGRTDSKSVLPIRWIVEDAMKFARRELKRQNSYDAVILDPPSYGHGPRGEGWRLSKHLPRLLTLCGELTAGQCRFMLLSCHTPDFDARRLERLVRDTWCSVHGGQLRIEPLVLRTPAGRELPSGIAVYWEPSDARHKCRG